MTFELPDDDKRCHHTGFEKKCCDLVTSKKCKRWRFLPGNDPFTGQARQQWGCTDDLVLFLQGEAVLRAGAAHEAVVEVRELATNPDYRRSTIQARQDKQLAIEGQNADRNHR